MASIWKRSLNFIKSTRSLLNYPKTLRSKEFSLNHKLQNANNASKNFENNPYFDKYAEKISNLQKNDEFTFQERLCQLKENSVKSGKKASINESSSKIPEKSSKMEKQFSYTQAKSLDSIMKLNMLQDLIASEISKLWIDYHIDKNAICATIEANNYEIISECAFELPMFLYPVLRKEGYEFLIGQFSGNNCYFTQLINYQAFKEESPVCLTLTHFTELKENKGIVLMSGEYDEKILSGIDAQFVANQLQLYYCFNNPIRRKLLRIFNKEPHLFKHSDIIKNLEII